VSELIRRASTAPAAMRKKGQAWVFEISGDTPVVSAARVRALLDESP